jgi:ligand-binding sensor domain-containing protein/signal transduction histidine kinase/predicted small lipoprotein YifL
MKTTACMRNRMKLWLALAGIALGLAGCGMQVPAPTPGQDTATPSEATAATYSYGEPPATIRFTRIGEESGLSQSSIHCILQDRAGFMWFGTEDGLNRYDGYNFKVYRPDPANPASISDRWITAIFQDHLGYIWVGTRLGGLNRYDPAAERFTRYTHADEIPNSISSNYVIAIHEDSLGHLWVGTEEGLDQYSPALDSFKHYDLSGAPLGTDLSYNITAIFEDTSGNLWVGSSALGLGTYDRNLGKFINSLRQFENPTALNSNNIRAIEQGPGNALWIATDNALNLFDPVSGNVLQYKHSPRDPYSLASNTIRTLYLDRAGSLWIGTTAGLDRLQPASGHFIHYQYNPNLVSSLSNDTVTAIYESSDNVMWVGTFGGGVNKYYRGQDRFAYYSHQPGKPSSLSGNIIFNIHVDVDRKAWLSIYGGGVDCLDMNSGFVTHYANEAEDPDSLSSNEVWSVYTDRNGTLWVGSDAGLDRRNPGSEAFIHYQHNPNDKQSLSEAPVYSILEDNDGNLWIGTEHGLDHFDQGSGTFTHFQHNPQDPASLSGNEIVTLLIDREGVLWAGSFNDGLNRYDVQTGAFTRFQHSSQKPDSLSNDSVLSIYQDQRGILWIGTLGGGLNRYEPGTDSFVHYFESDGLPSNVIYGIVEDDAGFLWLSTNNGMARFDPQEGTFRNYTARDGLQGNEFNLNAYARDVNGELYFGGVHGLTVFDPATITDSTFIPPIKLVSITQNEAPLDLETQNGAAAGITLRWPNNHFEFEFAALSYASPEHNRYAYRLDGFDADWNEIGNWRDGRYTNLPGGIYTLRLIGSNQDGVWNENGLAITVKVIPPFWQTPWFLASAAAGTMGLVFGGYWLRLRSIRANNRELERQVLDRTREIERLFEKTKELAVVEERNRLARELHDSAKQKAFAALAQLGAANGNLSGNPAAAKSHLNEAENLVYEVIEELTFLIQEIYPIALKEKGLATTLREYVFDWENRSDIRAEVHIESEMRCKAEIEQAIYRIIQEALSNVARHSGATCVDVTLSYVDQVLEASVADNGRGMDLQKQSSGIGLRSIHERAESLGGSVELKSAPGQGLRLTARIPIKPKRKPDKGESHGTSDHDHSGG